eukprot:342203_1
MASTKLQERTSLLQEPVEDLSCGAQCKNIYNKYFFVIGVIMSAAIGASYPHVGCHECLFRAEITSSWITVIFIFLTRGISTRNTSVKKATLFWELNLYTHIFIFIYMPCSVWLYCQILISYTNLNNALIEGLLILSALPTTLVTSIVLTAAAEGNEAAALVNATITKLTAILITPSVVILLIGNSTSIDTVDVFIQLTIKILLPFIIGQITRKISGSNARKWITKHKIYFDRATHIGLFYIVFCAISNSFKNGFDAEISDILYTFLVVVIIHFLSLIVNWFSTFLYAFILNNYFQCKYCKCKAFDIRDRIAILFLGVQKTAALGVPMIEIMFGDSDNIGLYVIPLIMYHPFQLLVDSLLVQPLSTYRKKIELKEKMYKQQIDEYDSDDGQNYDCHKSLPLTSIVK